MNELQLSRKDAARVKRLLRQPRPCLLCGTFPPVYQALFTPYKPEAWGGKPNKVRLLGYALCAGCFAMPAQARALAVEARIMAGLVGRGN